MKQDIIVTQYQHVTIITLNRPEARNALTPEMHISLSEAFDAFATDPTQRVAIVTGAGDRAFCAGSDLKRTVTDTGPKGVYSDGGYAGIASRVDMTKPVIAAVNGYAIGGGFELALACDILIASQNAVFALPEVTMGVAATGGGLHRLPRQIGYKKAMGLILTGASVDATEGERLGFVNEVVAVEDLMEVAMRWAQVIVANSPVAVRASKEIVNRGLAEPSLESAINEQRNYAGLIELWNSPDFKEGPLAFTEKRKPKWA